MEQKIYWNTHKIIYKFDTKSEMEIFLNKLKIIEYNRGEEKDEGIVIDEGQYKTSPTHKPKES